MEKFLKYAKKALYYVVYTALMVFNIYFLVVFVPEVYYSYADVPYWVEHYTPFGSGYDFKPNVWMRCWEAFLLFGSLFAIGYGNFLIYKKKSKGIFFLGFLIYVVILMYFCGDYVVDVIWGEVNFP